MKVIRNDGFSVVVVCTGNLIRSQYAAALLQERAESFLPRRVVVESAGTDAWEGLPVEERTLDCLRGLGLDVSTARSRRLREGMLTRSDLVLGMTAEHLRAAMTMAPSTLHRAFTLTGLAAILRGMPEQRTIEEKDPVRRMRAIVRQAAEHRSLGAEAAEVPDPLRRSNAVHEQMVGMVEDAVRDVAGKLFTSVRSS